MWVFSRHGYFSIVCGSDARGGVLPDTLMVRARMRQHLEDLQARLPALAPYGVVRSPRNDYRYRLVAPKAVVSAVVTALLCEVDYGNFKAAAHAHQGGADGGYGNALHRVWAVMHDLQAANEARTPRRTRPEDVPRGLLWAAEPHRHDPDPYACPAEDGTDDPTAPAAAADPRGEEPW